MEIFRDVVYDSRYNDICKMDIYNQGKESSKLLVYIHGGGLENGDKSEFDICAKEIAKHGVSVASINYRTYPNTSFPGFIKDCANAISFLKNNRDRYVDFSDLYIGGSSAGAYISMMLCFDKRYLQEVGLDPCTISGYIFDAGQPTTHFRVLQERGLDPRLIRIDEAAPLYFIDKQVENIETLPRFLVIVAENDLQNRLEQTYLLRQTMLHFGYPEENFNMHVIKNSTHTSYIGSEEYIRLLLDFLK